MLNYKPSQPHKYQGKQVIITSDRVLFNAQNDSILLISDKFCKDKDACSIK